MPKVRGVLNPRRPRAAMWSAVALAFLCAPRPACAVPSHEQGDFDNDGVVTGSDFLTWQSGFGAVGIPGSLIAGDANGDGAVSAVDLSAWIAHFGDPVVAVPTPEPSAVVLAVLGALAAFARRRTNG